MQQHMHCPLFPAVPVAGVGGFLIVGNMVVSVSMRACIVCCQVMQLTNHRNQ